ncbi:MAG: hypothetical protein IJN40_07180 [Clostridia bacterium]|nr:hypothetical protein [Clostridia bacterium]
MNKKFISWVLMLLIILTSANISYASTKITTVNESQSGTLIEDGRILTSDVMTQNGRFGIINFDLTQCIRELYLANTVKLNVKSNVYSANKSNSFAIEIISDSKEIYADLTHNYNEAVVGGVLSDGIEIYRSSEIGNNGTEHTTANIKNLIIEALESGNNNNLSLRLVLLSGAVVALQKNLELIIEYSDTAESDNTYCSLMASKFDINSVEGVSSGEINGNFDLPLFYKGVEILWSSNNDAIKISAHDDQRAVVTKSEDSSTPVTLTAVFTNKSLSTFVFREFNVSVPRIEPIDIAANKFNNTYKVSDEDYGAITKKLNLTSSFEGYDVSWVSSNNSIVNQITGEINASKDADVVVSLTPTISSDGTSRTLNTISVTVKRDISTTVSLPIASAGILISDGRILADESPTAYPSGRFGVINFDLTPYIPEIYLAKSVKLNMKSACYSANKNDPLDLAIISDAFEEYADLTHTHAQAVNAGLLGEMPIIYHADAIGNYGTSHTSSDIKDIILKEIENGNDNKLSLRLTTTQGVASLQRDLTLDIKYESDATLSEKYYKEILKSFNIETEANITSDAIDDSFTLPTFYKGSKIIWTSDKENITVSSDGMASVKKSADGDVLVTLTANLSYKDGSSYQKDFTLKVLQKDYIDVLADSFNENYRVSDEDYSTITKDLKLDKTFEGNPISWVSSNDAVVNSDSGRVIRSETEDIQVTLTPTIFYGGESRTLKPINVMVKKITPTTALASFTTAGTLISGNRILTDDNPSTYLTGRFGVINIDLTDYLSQLYKANTVKLKLKSGAFGDTKLNAFALEIIPDGKESYTDFSKTYDEAVAAGVLSDGTQIYYATEIGYNNAQHTTADIKDVLIKELESGNNNIISLRLVAVNGNVTLQRFAELEIKYDASHLTD